jgi:hypothetical protein
MDISMSIEAMKQWLETLDNLARYADTCELFLKKTHPGKAHSLRERVTNSIDAITSLRQAIAETEKQEPVAWQWLTTAHFRKKLPKDAKKGAWNPLYTTPQQRIWVGLTRDEIQDLLDIVDHYNYPQDLIVYTQAKLKDKNI